MFLKLLSYLAMHGLVRVQTPVYQQICLTGKFFSCKPARNYCL